MGGGGGGVTPLSPATIFGLRWIPVFYTAKTQYQKFETNVPKKELCSLSPNFHIHVFVSDLYVPMIGLLIVLQKIMWTDPENV